MFSESGTCPLPLPSPPQAGPLAFSHILTCGKLFQRSPSTPPYRAQPVWVQIPAPPPPRLLCALSESLSLLCLHCLAYKMGVTVALPSQDESTDELVYVWRSLRTRPGSEQGATSSFMNPLLGWGVGRDSCLPPPWLGVVSQTQPLTPLNPLPSPPPPNSILSNYGPQEYWAYPPGPGPGTWAGSSGTPAPGSPCPLLSRAVLPHLHPHACFFSPRSGCR